MDDTDFIYRLSKLGKYKYGVGHTIIKQYHINSFLIIIENTYGTLR